MTRAEALVCHVRAISGLMILEGHNYDDDELEILVLAYQRALEDLRTKQERRRVWRIARETRLAERERFVCNQNLARKERLARKQQRKKSSRS